MYLKCLSAILHFSEIHTSLFIGEIENEVGESIMNLRSKCCEMAEKIAELLGNILEDDKSMERIAICMEVTETLGQLAEMSPESVLIGERVKVLAKYSFKECKRHSGLKKRVLLLRKS